MGKWKFVAIVAAIFVLAVGIHYAMGEVTKVHVAVEVQGNTSVAKFVVGTTVYSVKVNGKLKDGVATVVIKNGRVVALIQDGKPYEVILCNKSSTMEKFPEVRP